MFSNHLFRNIINRSIRLHPFKIIGQFWHSSPISALGAKFAFIEGKTADRIEVDAEVGKSILDCALDHDVDIEGACGGEMACCTCHVILPKEYYDKLEKPSEEENDMLDLALGLTDTSRLCCQIKVSDDIEGCVFTVPEETNNML
mmetsp:Transcript_3733/g.3869  ORF Transcript_3733/g.3869 Transcript_3733/m.3869 type:complete len:145 (-) Transcript_3733:121-555(-)